MYLLLLICFLLLGSSLLFAAQTAPGGGWWGWKHGYYRHVGTQKQFFVDDFIIEEMDGLRRVLNQPVKYEGNPVLHCDQPWEQGLRTSQYGSVIYDTEQGLFKMWYGVRSYDEIENAAASAYATSEDGVVWTKPQLGLVEFRGSRSNNVIFQSDPPTKEDAERDPSMRKAYENSQRSMLDGLCVMKDPVEKDPAKKYKMLCRGSPALAYFMVNGAYSPDGIHWTPYEDNPIIPLRSDTENNVFWDTRIDRYVVLVRMFAAFGEVDPSSNPTKPGNLRIVGRSQSRDFVNWTPAEVVLIPDAKDRETGGTFHDMEVLQYEGVYFGFLGINRKYKIRSSKPQASSENHIEVHTTAEEGESEDVELTFSRDGVRWIRIGERKPFMPLVKPYDQRREWIHVFQPPLIVGDEIWIYYAGRETAHAPNPMPPLPSGTNPVNNAVALSKLRLDGFVSLEADNETGVLTTKPFKFNGDSLVVNADADDGELAVEILEYKNMYGSVDVTLIGGFTRAECVAFKGNNVRHTMAWKSGSELGSLEDKTIKLKFYLRRAKLYSFQFRD